MFICKKQDCLGRLIEDDADDRQEWCIRNYHCPNCNTKYIRRMDYKTQSALVESDILYMIDENGNWKEVE